MTRTLPIATAERGNETIRRIYLKSSTERARSRAAYHEVRVGVSKGTAEVQWLGAWSQADNALEANTRYDLTGGVELNYRLDEGDEVVLEVGTFGAPASLDGMSVEVKGARVGEVGEITHDRADGDYPGRAQIVSELFTVTGQIQDPGARDSVEALVSALNSTGINDWSHTVPLMDAPGTGDTAVATYEDSQDSAATTTAASFADGPVSITVDAPAGKTTYVSVYAHCTHTSNSGRNVLAIGIGDGSTDHNEAQSSAGSSGGNEGFVSTRLDTTISGSTTFTLRFYRVAGSGTSSTTYNLITATAVSI